MLRISKASRERVGMIRLFPLLSFLGEGASPFIDEGDGLTSERERESMYAKSCCLCHRVQDDYMRP